MSKDMGGAAFPIAHDIEPEPGFARSINVEYGMTLRDYFAAKAIQGLAANPGGPWQRNEASGWALTNCRLDEVTEVAYQIADAMLAERVK